MPDYPQFTQLSSITQLQAIQAWKKQTSSEVSKVKINGTEISPVDGVIDIGSIPNESSIDNKISSAISNLQLGTASKANTGTSSGNVPVIDNTGKLPSSIIPDSSGSYVSTTEFNSFKSSNSTELNSKAPLNNPQFTGSVTIGSNEVATQSWTTDQLSSYVTTSTFTSLLNEKAPINNPIFSGTVKVGSDNVLTSSYTPPVASTSSSGTVTMASGATTTTVFDSTQVSNITGNLSSLTTSQKSDLVSAINELVSRISALESPST